MIQKERNFEEKIFLKQREQLMQRQSDLAIQLSPKSRRKEMLSASKLVLPEQSSPPRSRVTLSSGKPFLDTKHASASSHLTRDAPVPQKMPAELKSRLSDNVLSVSLPDINVAGTKTLKKSSEIKLWKEDLSQAGQNEGNEEASVIKDRENLRERRYLRTNSAEN